MDPRMHLCYCFGAVMLAADWQVTVLALEAHPLPYYTLVLRGPEPLSQAQAGQFLMVEVGTRLEPYLRRAFSVHDVSKVGGYAHVALLAKVVGRGTALLAAARPGEILRVLGPLGRGFSLPGEGPVCLVAGGVGSAPLFLLARQLLAREVSFDFLYGGRSLADLPRQRAFARLAVRSGGRLFATTEDGSQGEKGVVTNALERRLEEGAYRRLYTCGPMEMMAAVARLGARHRVDGEAALETAMGCGYGACLGCAVRDVSGGFVLCCKDGPVFGLQEVRW